MCAIFVLHDSELVEMVERPFAKEKHLQLHLAAHPELLSAEAPEDERRRWLLVKREMGVPGREEGSDRFSLDHLFVDQDAIPTFVEVKRASNTDIRRKVVGQMLEYAANASAYWDAGGLRSSFESRFPDVETANDALSEFIEDDLEAEEFWDAVSDNLKERRLRLIFVADHIPRELRSIVEFLNEQLERTDVIAVEVKQYEEPPDGQRVNIVPRVIGETEMARRVKRTGSRRPRQTEEQFYAQMRDAYPPDVAERVLALYEHAKAHGSRQKFGRGKSPTTTAWMGEHEDSEIANPLALTFWGGGHGIGVNMKYFRGRRTTQEMERLVELLRRLPATAEALDEAVAKDYRSFCTFRAERVLATDEDLEAFKRVLDQAAVRGAGTD